MNEDLSKVNFSLYYNNTLLHPLAAAMLVLTGILVFVLPKRYVAASCLPLLCFVSGAQRIVVADIDFGFLRILGICILARVIARGELRNIKVHLADVLVFIYSFSPVLMSLVRGRPDMMMMLIGMGFDVFSMYILGRVFLANLEFVRVQIRALALVSIPLAIFFFIEGTTRHNYFSIFGGVAELTRMRDGQLRAQGAFAHPILAGAWFVAVIPLFLSQWKADVNRVRGQTIAVVGTICGIMVMNGVSSSTPVGGLLAIGVAYLFYPFRSQMSKIALLAIAFGVMLHFAVNDGLHGILFTRATLVVGSTGDHRFNLYEAALNRIPEWFMFGVDGTAHWGNRLWDITSEYVYALVKGGILGLGLLIWLICLAYRGIGRVMRGANRRDTAMLYGLGVSLFGHLVMFSAVAYFGQITYLFYSLLGSMISLGALKAASPRKVAKSVRSANPHARRRNYNMRMAIAGNAS